MPPSTQPSRKPILSTFKVWFTSRVKGFSPLATTSITTASLLAGIMFPIVGGILTFWVATTLWSKHIIKKSILKEVSAQETNALAIEILTGKEKKRSAVDQLEDLKQCSKPIDTVQFSILAEQLIDEFVQLLKDKKTSEFEKSLCASMAALRTICSTTPAAYEVISKLERSNPLQGAFSDCVIPLSKSHEFYENLAQLNLVVIQTPTLLDPVRESAHESIDVLFSSLDKADTFAKKIVLLSSLNAKLALWPETLDAVQRHESLKRIIDETFSALSSQAQTNQTTRIGSLCCQYLSVLSLSEKVSGAHVNSHQSFFNHLGQAVAPLLFPSIAPLLNEVFQLRPEAKLFIFAGIQSYYTLHTQTADRFATELDDVAKIPNTLHSILEIVQHVYGEIPADAFLAPIRKHFPTLATTYLQHIAHALKTDIRHADRTMDQFIDTVSTVSKLALPSPMAGVQLFLEQVRTLDQDTLQALRVIGKRYLNKGALGLSSLNNWITLMQFRAAALHVPMDPVVVELASNLLPDVYQAFMSAYIKIAFDNEQLFGLEVNGHIGLSRCCKGSEVTTAQQERVAQLLCASIGDKELLKTLDAKPRKTEEEWILRSFSKLDLKNSERVLQKLEMSLISPLPIASWQRSVAEARDRVIASQDPSHIADIRFPEPIKDSGIFELHRDQIEKALDSATTDGFKTACERYLNILDEYRKYIDTPQPAKTTLITREDLYEVCKLIMFSNKLPEKVRKLVETRPSLVRLKNAITISNQIFDALGMYLKFFPGCLPGDILITDAGLENQFYEKEDVLRTPSWRLVPQGLRSENLFAIVPFFTNKKIHSGLISTERNEERVFEVGARPSGEVGDNPLSFVSTMVSLIYRPDFSKILTEEGARQVALLYPGIDVQSILRSSFSGCFQASRSSLDVTNRTFSMKRAVYSYFLNKAARLPSALATRVTTLARRVILGKIGHAVCWVFRLPSIEEQDLKASILCSEYVALATQGALQTMNERLNDCIPEPHPKIQFFKEIFPASLDMTAVHPGYLEELIRPFYTLEPAPLIHQLVLGSDHPLLQRSAIA